MSHSDLTKTRLLNWIKLPIKASGIYLLIFAIIILPFNDLPYFKKIVGELSCVGAFYPMAVLVIIYFIKSLCGTKIKFPKHISFGCLILFLGWIGVSGLVNLPEILLAMTKGRMGTNKLLVQIMLVIFTSISSIVVYNVALQVPNFFQKYRKYILWSLVVVIIGSLVEVPFLFGSSWAKMILGSVNKLIHTTNQSLLYCGRFRSFSGEASWFGVYCSFVFPWLFSSIYTEKKRIWLPFCMIGYFSFLVALTFSRTAYIIILTQFVLFLFLIRKVNVVNRKMVILSLVLLLVVVIMPIVHLVQFSQANVYTSLLNISSKKDYGMSNIARYGSMITGLKIGLHNPLFGVGLGQYGFHMANFVPDWAKISPEIQEWMSSASNTSWAPVHNIYARIFAELGSVGLVIWLFLWLSLLRSCYRRYAEDCKLQSPNSLIGVTVIVAIVGAMLSGLNLDSFRLFEYWITLGVVWVYLNNGSKQLQVV